MDQITRRDQALPYIADEACWQQMLATRRLLHALNHADPGDPAAQEALLRRILGSAGKNISIQPPFYCDYGFHITVGNNFFANFNLTILDVGTVTIGDYVFIGPNVGIYTAGHPVHPDARNSMYEYGIPIRIGSNCWIGGHTVIMPGVTIGNGTVVGAGSVVTKDLPAGVVAAGNPCRVRRTLTEADRQYYFKKREFDAEAMQDVEQSKAENHIV